VSEAQMSEAQVSRRKGRGSWYGKDVPIRIP
jgi:hypothetical protein